MPDGHSRITVLLSVLLLTDYVAALLNARELNILLTASSTLARSVHTRLWWYVLHLIIQRVAMNRPIIQFHLPVLPVGYCVLHPVLIVSLWEVLPGVCPTALLASLSRVHGDGCIDQQVLELQGLG
jgi:hypothetical protein